MNKRGAELTVTTIILIVLGVLILVFLIIGFSIGWNKIFPFISPSNNVDDILRQCESSCNGNSKYNYCTSVKQVVVQNDILQNGIVVTVGKKLTASCYDLATIAQLGLPRCPSIDCDAYSEIKYAQLACDTDNRIFVDSPKDATDRNSYSIFYLNRDSTKLPAHCAPKPAA